MENAFDPLKPPNVSGQPSGLSPAQNTCTGLQVARPPSRSLSYRAAWNVSGESLRLRLGVRGRWLSGSGVVLRVSVWWWCPEGGGDRRSPAQTKSKFKTPSMSSTEHVWLSNHHEVEKSQVRPS